MAVERKGARLSLTLILLGVGLVSVLPFLWVIAGSFKDEAAISQARVWPWQSYQVRRVGPEGGEPRMVTERVTLNNYRQVTTRVSGLGTYYFNTVYLSVAGTFLALLVGTLAAYGFARFRFRGSWLLYGLFLFTIMIPGEVALIGRFELMLKLNLLDTVTGLLAAYVAGNLLLVIFIMRNVFESIPQDLTDAAMIDGASSWQVFWEVMIPMGRNGLAACGILTFLSIWNEFFFALTFTFRSDTRTLPVGITMLKSQWGLMDNGVLFATVLLSFLPIVIVFILLQRYFVRGLSAGALKQ